MENDSGSALVISVRLYDGRYHGAGEWPPAPARLFQALLAGAGLSGPLGNDERTALTWLEQRAPPLIAAPRQRNGSGVTLYVPNNDLDKVGGDPRRIAKIRGSQKVFKPRLFDQAIPFLYTWTFDEDAACARNALIICDLAERLYQFGRGIDFACAWGEVLDGATLDEQLLAYQGTIHRPSLHGSGIVLQCPAQGSLKSLEDRYRASGGRFSVEQRGRTTAPVFTKLPTSRFTPVAYDSPVWRYIFELREPSTEAPFAVWPLAQISRLVERLRDGAVARLGAALPSRRAEIDRVLVGRKPDGANRGPPSDRIRILPLPSIGHHYADRGIRRVLVEVPPNCSLRPEDVQWAFSGLELVDPATGEALDTILTPAAGESTYGMLAHYGIGSDEAFRRWRTVSPAALPESAARRRIDPERQLDGAKAAKERAEEYARAAGAVVQALRHAAIMVHPSMILVQREPFESAGERAESFAEGTRFSKHRLWHVDIELPDKIRGPLVIGDGRFLGLGIMAPMPGEGAVPANSNRR